MARDRATAIVVRDGRYLLVRDRGRQTFALPGGGIEDGESASSAMARELLEETGLRSTTVTRLFTFGGKHNDHVVFRVEAQGDANATGEVEDFTWWNGNDDTPVFPHVTGILKAWQGI
jgi:ADP-ribose pyrophosphatase YjhB (NUDIX family)